MGLFNSIKKAFHGNATTSEKDSVHCNELIRFISFAQKTKPLMKGNYGIKVKYSRPKHEENKYTGDICAEFGFWDFNHIGFARDFALKASQSELNKRMVQIYYDSINKDAGLTPDDWPYRMDVYDFGRMLTNSDEFGLYSLIPDQYSDDIFTMKIKGGFASQNGALAYNLVEAECRKHFPNLNIKKTYANVDGFHFTISI